MDYTMADSLLQGRNKQSRKYANNTYLQRRGDDIALRLHTTDIVTWKANGDVILDSGGWHTPTTKERLNRVLPQFLGIYQEKGRWFVSRRSVGSESYSWNSKTVAVYQDGMTIKPDGTFEGAGEYQPKADKQMKARIRKFANLCADSIPLDMPGSGDCWYCGMKSSDGQTMGDLSGNTDHLESHMDEGYVVPALVWQAMESCGYQPERSIQFSMVFGGDQGQWDKELGQKTVKRSVYRYMSKQLGFAV